MRWGFRRQFLIAISIIVLIGLVLLGGWFVFFYHAPTCTDGVQNQDEMGIDCGGVCKKLCTAPRVSALWARAVPVAPGVYHAIALVRNPENDAGTASLPYNFFLYDAQNILVAERFGVMRLDAGEVAPLFEPNIITNNRVPVHAFVSFGQAVWEKMSQTSLPVSIVSQSLDESALRLTAHIKNTSVYPLPAMTFTAILYDANANAVNASQTIVPGLSASGETDIAFTWQQPFTVPVVRFEITPRLQ